MLEKKRRSFWSGAVRVGLIGAALLVTALVSGGDAHAVPSCKAGWEKSGLLCYPKCKPGYKGVGPVCWYRGQKSYGRGAGYALWSKKKCFRKHGSCEKGGLIWYPKCKPGFKGVGPVCWSRNKLSYGRGAGRPLETVKKAFKDAGKKIKKGFQWLGKKIKEGFKKAGAWMKKHIFDKIKKAFLKFGKKVMDWILGKGFIGGLIRKAIVSLTKKVGFNTADVKKIVGKTGRVTREAIRKVVLHKLLVQYLQPLIVAKAAKLIDKGLKFVQKPIDIAVGAIIAGVGSIPFAGGVLAAGLSAAYSFGMDKLRSFLAKTISKLLVGKFITPMVHKGLEWIRRKWKPAAQALDQLFKDSYYFFDTYIRIPGGAAAPRPVPSSPVPSPAAPPASAPGADLARGKPATQSGIGWGGSAGRAVDGNTDGVYNHRSVTHTSLQVQPWWQVDLGRVHQIREIKLFNRTDCCSERLSNFVVMVSNRPFGRAGVSQAMGQAAWKQVHAARAGKETTLKVGRPGRYVRVQLLGRNYLSLAEVQVIGK